MYLTTEKEETLQLTKKKKEIPESKFEISHIQIITQIHVH